MSRRIQQIVIIGGTIFFVALSLGPLAYVLYVSLLSPAGWPQAGSTLNLEHCRTVLTGPALHFPRQLLNSVVVAFISAAGSVTLASLAAYAITRLPLPGRMTILMAVLVAAMFPQIGIVGYLFRMMSALGLINTYPALCLPYVSWTLPISLWILVGYFAKMPRDLGEGAASLGLHKLQTLWKIILPQALIVALRPYGNEIILMVKATSLASIITLMEMTGLARAMISETFRAVEVFAVAGGLYLAINFLVTRAVMALEYSLSPHLRDAPASQGAPALANVH